MKLNIKNEFGSLKSVVVCFGEFVPDWKTNKSSDPEFLKYHQRKWDRDLLLKQQEKFFKLLVSYGVKLFFPETTARLPHQMFTRDTGFVIGDKLFLANKRKFGERNGENKYLVNALNLEKKQKIEIDNEIEGGDVLIAGNNRVYVGCGSRTNNTVEKYLAEKLVKTKMFNLGNNVMHLDTRLTILPNNYLLINSESFNKFDLEYLQDKYKLIEVNEYLGTNVLMINPETIVVAKQHPRIEKTLKNLKFKVETIDYSEPINLCGSFRCTTMPLERED